MQEKVKEMPSCGGGSRNRAAIIIIAAILALILIFGAVLGIGLLIREAGAVVSYNGITLSEGVASYIASTQKATYLRALRDRGIDAYDSAEFWQSECRDGVNYKADFAAQLEKYVRWVAIAAYFYDRHKTLDAASREWISEKTRDVLDNKVGGSVAKFNEEAAPMGFTYADFCSATELLYKAERATEAVYGVDGVGLATDKNRYILEDYLKSYANVQLLYIRKSDKFLLDDKGNRVVEGGRDVLTPLSDAERAERLEHISDITDAIEAWRTGGNGKINEDYFNGFYTYYNDEPEYSASGYFFKRGTAYTEWYDKEVFPGIVDTALEMNVGDFARVDLDNVVVFLYRKECPQGAYMAYGIEDFFGDFYKNCAAHHFNTMTSELLGDVTVKDAYYGINLVKIYQNTKFKIS